MKSNKTIPSRINKAIPSRINNITDTIEIKNNGDIYINNQPAESNECGYYKLGDNTFYIDGL